MMNKKDLTKDVATKTGYTQAVVDEVISSIIESIETEVSEGGYVNLVGFGKFYSSSRNARTGRNPQNGETISIPASKSPRFKAGKKFKDIVNM